MPDVPSPVSIEAEAPPGQLLAVREAFEQHGFAVEVVANYERNSAGELPWVVLVAVLSFNGFLKGLGETAGKDANEALKDWVLDVFAARQDAGPRGTLRLADSNHTQLEFPTTIPDRAFDAVRAIDWDKHSGDRLVWDDKRGLWYARTKR